ncbi:two-component system sensor histidine kinase NtrB [Aquibacillus saliphilus]|uniref:two-component system sensor histidine kinase NtrB n=1 Tax=Aquibacillus saliphilus TaxID=1909422 RepID=UPI001CF054D9|nr:ATP-binding protein [Aquibacillus saliphilus]
MNGFSLPKGKRLYVLFISIMGVTAFLLHNPFQAVAEISGISDWLLTLLLVAAVILSNRYLVYLPPEGNSLSMDSSIYIASTFIFGLELTLFLLFVGSLLGDLKQKRVRWQFQVFNFASFTLIICGAYYLFAFTGGKIGYIEFASIFSYLLALVGYFLINILLIGLYFIIPSSQNLISLLKKILIEALPTYVVTFALAFILALLLESSPIFGVIIFTFLVTLLSYVFRRYFELYEEASGDRAYIEQIMNSLPVGIITFDEKTGDISLNAFATNLLGVSKEEVKKVMSSTENHRYENKSFWDIVQTKQVVQNVTVDYKTEKKTSILLVSQSELISFDKLIGRIYHFVDVTERDELEKRMHQSEKLAVLGEVSAGAAHEIRNPLTVIKGFLTLMKQSLSKSDQDKFYIPLLLKEFDQINTIVEEMLLLAKPGQPQLKEAYIRDIFNEIIPHYRPASTIYDIRFNIDIDETPLLLDTKQIKQALFNLIRNSSESMDGEGTITVYSNTKRESYQLFIQDTGPGIPEKLQDSIFDPFLTNKETGTGLGLSIVQRIIENHHGRVELFESSDKGTTFLITFPLIINKATN